MIVGFEGGMGTGKTIGMVRYILKDYANGMIPHVNFGLLGIDYEILNVLKIMENKNLNNVTVGIDEITVFLDCRKSSSKMNRIISYFILQTRKRKVNLYYSTQSLSMIDKRLLEHTDFQVICNFVYDENGKNIDNVRKYSIIDCRRRFEDITITRILLDISKYYKYYDTNEVILPPL